MTQDLSLVARAQQMNQRFKGIASSHGLNEFVEGSINDLGELYRGITAALIAVKRTEDIVNAQTKALQKQVSSLSLSNRLGSTITEVDSQAEMSGYTYSIAALSEAFRGIDFSVKASVNRYLTGVVIHDPAGPAIYSKVTSVPTIFSTAAGGTGIVVLYADGGTWKTMESQVSLVAVDAINKFYYDETFNVVYVHYDHLTAFQTAGTKLRFQTATDLTLNLVDPLPAPLTDVNKYYYNLSSNVLVVHETFKDAVVLLAVTPSISVSTLDEPASRVIVDFFSPSNIWTAASSRLASMTDNVRYRILTDPDSSYHNPLYGQITLPIQSEDDKLIIHDLQDVFVPDSLSATTRFFRIHKEVLYNSGGKRYFNPLNANNPFQLQVMLDRVREWNDTVGSTPDFSSPEIPGETIPSYFDQSDPLYAVDGRNDTPAWMVSQYVDLDQALPFEEGSNLYPTSHLVFFYDVEIPQDISSHMFLNTIQIHTVPLFGTHLVDVRYKVGEPFDTNELGRQFHMLQGVSGFENALPETVGIENTTLGRGQNIFWNASYLELHVKKTEANHIRLVFVTDYDPTVATRRNVVAGATHIGVYFRKYKETGSFQLEFNGDAGFELSTLGKTPSSWVNNRYALFVVDPSVDPQFGSVRAVGDSKVEVNFGVRTDDLGGTIEAFDNSATPSFQKIILE